MHLELAANGKTKKRIGTERRENEGKCQREIYQYISWCVCAYDALCCEDKVLCAQIWTILTLFKFCLFLPFCFRFVRSPLVSCFFFGRLSLAHCKAKRKTQTRATMKQQQARKKNESVTSKMK